MSKLAARGRVIEVEEPLDAGDPVVEIVEQDVHRGHFAVNAGEAIFERRHLLLRGDQDARRASL